SDGIHPRLASRKCIHEPDDAGGTRHIAFHVLHTGSGLDRNTSGIETDALTDKRNRRLPRSSAIPTHHDDTALACRTLADAEKRIHTEFFHRPNVEDFDCNTKFFQYPCTAREFFWIKDVGRFVDQISGQNNAIGNRHARRIGFANRGNITDGEGDVSNSGWFFILLALGFVAIECVCAQACALRQVRRLLGPHSATRQLGEDRPVSGRIRQPADRKTPQPDKVLWREFADLPCTNNDQTRRLEPRRHNEIQGRALFPRKPLWLRGAFHDVGHRPKRLARRWTEFQVVVAKDDEHAPSRGSKGAKTELQGVGHRKRVLCWQRRAAGGLYRSIWRPPTAPAKPIFSVFLTEAGVLTPKSSKGNRIPLPTRSLTDPVLRHPANRSFYTLLCIV